MTTNDGGADQYIGKPLSELPDGSVAVVQYAGSGSDVYIRTKGGFATASKHGDEWVPWCDHGSGDGVWPTVLHVLKLGKPRPERLDGIDEGDVWGSPSGALCIKDRGTIWYLHTNGKRGYANADGAFLLKNGWTRLGPIEGIVINGKVYGKEASDG